MRLELRNSLLATAEAVKRAGWRILYVIVLEAFFFIFYGFVRAGLFTKLLEYLSALGISFIRTSNLASSGQILSLALVTIVSLFLIYCVFQGTIWWLCHWLLKVKEDYSSYLLSFSRVSLWWGLLILIYNIISLAVFIRSTVSKQPESTATIVLLNIFLAVIAYFAVISYSTRPHSIRKSVVIGVKDSIFIIPYFVIVAAVFAALYFALSAVQASYIASLILQIVLVLPALAVSRMYLISALRRVEK